MKINGIKALDYQCQGESLTLVLSETTFDAVSNLNTARKRAIAIAEAELRAVVV